MTINLRLEAHQPAITGDELGREWIGYKPTMTDHELYERNRGMWVLGPRAHRERLVTFSYEGTVRTVVAVDDIETLPSPAGGRPKQAVVGGVLAVGDPDYDALINLPIDPQRNPVSYTPDTASGIHTCACGCEMPIPAHRAFVPGHDQRAVHDRISRQWGNTLTFVRWFDRTFPAHT